MSTFRTGQLPAPLGDRLVGRDDDLRRIEQALSRSSSVTIMGPGGVGKTRIATEAARRLGAKWSSATAYVDLHGVEPSDPLEDLVLAALRDAGGTGADLAEVARSLSPALVVLDNLEQLEARPASLVQMLSNIGELRVMCTSRLPVGFPNEVVLPLEPLDDECALELLAERARDAGAPPEGLEVLLRRLGGLPLAIEVVAPRLRVLAPQDLLAVLEEDDILAESFDWSWRLLTEAEQRDLGLLAPAQGPFSLPDAARMLGVGVHDAAARLQLLADASLLHVRRVGGASQYLILEPIRRCAVHKLRDEHPTLYSTAVRRHAESWLEDMPKNPSLTGVARIVRDCQVADPNLAVRVAIQSLDPLYVRHNADAAARVVRRALDACTEDMIEERIDVLCVAAEVWARHFGELRRAAELVGEAFELGAEHPTRRVSVRNARGLVALADDDFDAAEQWLTEAVQHVDGTPDDPAGASALANLGLCCLATGRFTEASDWMERALEAELPRAEHHAVQGRLAIALFHSGAADRAGTLLERGRIEAERDGLDTMALSYAMHLGRLRIDPQPRDAIARALGSDDPAIWLDGALLAWTLGDAEPLRWLDRKQLRRVAPLTTAIATAAAALSLSQGRPLESSELARRAVSAAPMREAATRAIIARIAHDACRNAGRDREAASWLDAALRDAKRSEVDSVQQLIEGAAITPMFEVLVAERARTEHRYTRWSWVDLALAMEPAQVGVAAPPSSGPTWRFANEARMVQCPDGKTLNLGRRGPMRKILWHLVQRHVDAPGEGVSVDDVFEIGWPGEILDYELALARVYNTVRAARSLGFEDLIVTQDDGYLLDPNAEIVVI